MFSCNDGDVAVQDISFENATGANCGNISYKIKGNEVLIIKYADITKAYIADQTEKDKPISLTIDENNPVIYRVYNAEPTAANFCGSQVPPATPIVVEEWTATSGTILITTTIAKSTDTTSNATTITGYNNFVQLKNITFKKPNGDQFYETFNFGNITIPFSTLNFAFTSNIEQCATSNNLTSKIGSVALLSFSNIDNLIQQVDTPVNMPRVSVINLTNNKLFYRVFSAIDLNSNYKCKTAYVPTDTLLQEWIATSGTVEVTTTSSGGLYTHKVRLKGVKFTKGKSDFYLGDDFALGQLQN